MVSEFFEKSNLSELFVLQIRIKRRQKPYISISLTSRGAQSADKNGTGVSGAVIFGRSVRNFWNSYAFFQQFPPRIPSFHSGRRFWRRQIQNYWRLFSLDDDGIDRKLWQISRLLWKLLFFKNESILILFKNSIFFYLRLLRRSVTLHRLKNRWRLFRDVPTLCFFNF